MSRKKTLLRLKPGKSESGRTAGQGGAILRSHLPKGDVENSQGPPREATVSTLGRPTVTEPPRRRQRRVFTGLRLKKIKCDRIASAMVSYQDELA